MEPREFGPFLRDLRRRKALTQTQLAERLGVSGAAVSKWERGRCLPDLAKLEALAEVLEVSLLELMRCGREHPEALSLPQAASKPALRWRRWLAAALCAALLAVFLHFFPLHHIYMVWWPSWYETGEISMLAYIGSREDRQTAQPIMELAERAFSDLSCTYEEAMETYGELGRYCIAKDYFPEAVSQTHTLELWSAHFSGGYGHIWACYSQRGYDEAGELRTGSFRIPALWTLERQEDGGWQVISIKEHP